MKKVNKKVEAMRQKNARKRAARKAARKGIRQENLNRRQNVIAEKKEELFNQWLAAVGKRFDEGPAKE